MNFYCFNERIEIHNQTREINQENSFGILAKGGNKIMMLNKIVLDCFVILAEEDKHIIKQKKQEFFVF